MGRAGTSILSLGINELQSETRSLVTNIMDFTCLLLPEDFCCPPCTLQGSLEPCSSPQPSSIRRSILSTTLWGYRAGAWVVWGKQRDTSKRRGCSSSLGRAKLLLSVQHHHCTVPGTQQPPKCEAASALVLILFIEPRFLHQDHTG